ncbi:MAG: ABC transporter ATP-binding protein, partial [Oscillospiraceae bacterium]|nr:ABC transporter ATP-binding protein [Oscillospiraceae bacterium]
AGFTGIMILAGGAIIAVSYLFRERIKNLHKEMQQRHGRLRAFLQESIENLTVTKVFRAEKQMATEADALQGDYFSARMARRRMSVLANAGFGFLFQAGYLAALAYGGLGLLNGSLTYGSLLAILQLIGQLQSPLSGLSGIIPQYYSMIASCERMQEIEQLPEEKAGEEIDPGALYQDLKEIVFDRVSFGYGRERVLDTFCCTIPKSDLTAILGRSGRGKSTLLKLLLGIYAAENGEVFLRTAEDDVPITSAMRGMFAYVPQGNLLFSGTILENILFVRGDAPEEEIREALRISGADAFVDALPQGVHTKLGEKGLGLSEGQVQRLAIARALLSGAPILLLDEATSALDAHTERELLERLCALKTHTIVMISHKKAVLEVCDHCIDID